jgi:hypothetical protein
MTTRAYDENFEALAEKGLALIYESSPRLGPMAAAREVLGDDPIEKVGEEVARETVIDALAELIGRKKRANGPLPNRHRSPTEGERVDVLGLEYVIAEKLHRLVSPSRGGPSKTILECNADDCARLLHGWKATAETAQAHARFWERALDECTKRDVNQVGDLPAAVLNEIGGLLP